MSRLGELKELISSINDKIDGICSERCKEMGIDYERSKSSKKPKKRVGESESKNPSAEESPKIPPKNSESPSSNEEEQQTDISKISVDSDAGKEEIDAEKLTEQPSRSRSIEVNDGDGKEDYTEYLLKKQAIQDRLKDNYFAADQSPDMSLAAKLSDDSKGKKKRKKGSTLGNLLKKRLTKHGLKILTKLGLKKMAKTAGNQVAKSAGKQAAKSVGKMAGKQAAKVAAKKIPFGIGFIPAAGFAAHRFMNGDVVGGAGELLSGAAAAVPVLGTGASLGIDALLAKRDYDNDVGESYTRYVSLYDRAKAIFESEFGINESRGGCCFDDYVLESKIGNGVFSSERGINESEVFYGYSTVVESFNPREDELERLFKRISPDGKVSLKDIMPNPSDTADIKRVKSRIRKLLEEDNPLNGDYRLNQKEMKKSLDSMRNQSGQLTNGQLWHKGLDDTSDSIANTLSNYGIPQELTRKLNLPRKLSKIAGAGVGGLLFGPVGAVAGYGLADLLARGHEKYKKEQYEKLHGIESKDGDGIAKRVGVGLRDNIGGLIGTGIGTMLGGPAGGIIGAGLGTLGQKAAKWIANKKKKTEPQDGDENGGN